MQWTLPEQRLTTEKPIPADFWNRYQKGFRSITFFEGYAILNKAENMMEASELVVNPVAWGNINLGTVQIVTPKQDDFFKMVSWNDSLSSLAEIQKTQQDMLREMGLEFVRPEEPLAIKPGEYSPQLRTAIEEARESIREQGGEGLPLLFISPLKRHPDHFPELPELTEELKDVAQNVKAAVVVNRGSDKPWDSYQHNKGQEIHDKMLKVKDRKATMIQVKPFDMLHMAAYCHLARETGGCALTVFGGPTIVATLFQTPQVLIEMPVDYKCFQQGPPQQTVLPYHYYNGKVTRAVQEKIGVQ
jgi:hypothetical protein